MHKIEHEIFFCSITHKCVLVLAQPASFCDLQLRQ
jgi:hypothetical protein